MVRISNNRSVVIYGLGQDLDDCLDLAVGKGKAGGEPKPTERKTIVDVAVEFPYHER